MYDHLRTVSAPRYDLDRRSSSWHESHLSELAIDAIRSGHQLLSAGLFLRLSEGGGL